MNRLVNSIADIGMDTISLAGTLPTKLRAVRGAGFSQIMLSARTFRVFPGEGANSSQVTELVTRLDSLGYAGDYSFEVFNDDYQSLPPETVAARAYRSALWLGEDVLKRSVPMPGQMRLRAPRDAAEVDTGQRTQKFYQFDAQD